MLTIELKALFVPPTTDTVGIVKRTSGNYNYFRATVTERLTNKELKTITVGQAKRYSKQFNINKLGEEAAMSQAKAWLEYKRSELGYVNY